MLTFGNNSGKLKLLFTQMAVVKKKKTDNKSHRDGKPGFVCLLVLRFQRALTNILLGGERSQDAFNFPRWRNNNSTAISL